jgi:hypothetical protein
LKNPAGPLATAPPSPPPPPRHLISQTKIKKSKENKKREKIKFDQKSACRHGRLTN